MGATWRDRAREAIKEWQERQKFCDVKMNKIKKDLPPRGTGRVNGNADALQTGVPRSDEEREARHEELTKNPPFGPWKDFDDCMTEMRKKYPEENARRVCGALKRDLEKEESFEGCVNHFLAQSDFEAKGGKTREESARALCAYIGRKSGKIASADYTNPEIAKDMTTQFRSEEDSQADVSTIVSLVQELAMKVEDLIGKLGDEKTPEEVPTDQIEEAIHKNFEKLGFVQVASPDAPVHNLPITKSQTGLSAEEIASLPWSDLHKAAEKERKR